MHRLGIRSDWVGLDTEYLFCSVGNFQGLIKTRTGVLVEPGTGYGDGFGSVQARQGSYPRPLGDFGIGHNRLIHSLS